MSADVIDLRDRQRAQREDPEQRWLRDQVSFELARCRLSLVQIANAVAEGKRLLRLGWPKENAAAQVVREALSPRGPNPLPPAA